MLQTLLALARLTFAEPRRAAAFWLANTPPLNISVELAVIVMALGSILANLLSLVSPDPSIEMFAALLDNPILFAIVQLMLLMISALLIHVIGRMFDGVGSFEQALILSVWLQFIMLGAQVLLIPIILILPSLAQGITLAVNIFVVWLLVNFIAELHQFRSLLKVFAGIIATTFAASFVVVFLLAFIGFGVEGV